MHLFKQFWRLLSKNRASIIIYGSIAVAMLVISGFIATDKYKASDTEVTAKPLDISYVDYDNSVLSKGLIEYFATNNNCMDFSDKTEEQINNMAYFTITSFHMDIPEGFEERLNDGEDIHIEYTASTDSTSYVTSCVNAVDTFVNSYLTYRKLGLSDEEAVAKTLENMLEKLDIKVYSESGKIVEGTVTEAVIYQMLLYLFYISFGVICLTGGVAIVKSSDQLVRGRVMSAPVSPEKITIANTLGVYSLGLLIWGIATAAMFIFGMNTEVIQQRGLIISLGSLIMILTNCSVTVLIASFGPKNNNMSMIVNIVSLSSSFLGGVFVPQWLLGKDVIAVAKFLPSYWSTYALNMCFTASGAGLKYEMPEVFKAYGIELAFAVVLVMIAIIVKKAKAQR